MTNPVDLIRQGVSGYIDPGSITMVIQIAIVCAVTGLFMLRVFWGRIKAFLIRLFRKKGDD